MTCNEDNYILYSGFSLFGFCFSIAFFMLEDHITHCIVNNNNAVLMQQCNYPLHFSIIASYLKFSFFNVKAFNTIKKSSPTCFFFLKCKKNVYKGI